MLLSTLCEQVNFMDFATVGTCFVQQTVFGDFVLFGVLLTIMFASVLVWHRFPYILMIPFSTAMFYGLYIIQGGGIFLSLFLLMLVISGAVTVVGLLGYLNR